MGPKPNRPTREELAKRTIDRVKRFTDLLASGVPIECTTISRIDTPDGPATIRTNGVMNAPASE